MDFRLPPAINRYDDPYDDWCDGCDECDPRHGYEGPEPEWDDDMIPPPPS